MARATRCEGARFRLEPASTDASFRRYFRVFLDDGRTLHRDGRAARARGLAAPFVKVAGLLARRGPERARSLASGSRAGLPPGHRPWDHALPRGARRGATPTGSSATRPRPWCAGRPASRAGELPEYDEALLARELDLFPDWYVERHLGVKLTPSQREALDARVPQGRSRAISREPRVFVHRDFMPRNLMVCEPNPGILDFQDAVHGPVSYDVACLYRDAFVRWDEEVRARRHDPLLGEGARARACRCAPISPTFWRDVEWMGLQRHLKVAGIFARLNYRDGKDALPRGHAALHRLRAPRGVALPRARAAGTARSTRSRDARAEARLHVLMAARSSSRPGAASACAR